MANGRPVDPSPANQEPASDVEMEVASLAMVQQLRLQAQQLAEHLRGQEANLDRREAEFQARLADLEQRERNCRLWLKDRHEELAEREAVHLAREKRFLERAAEQDQANAECAELNRQRESDLQARRDALDAREASIETAEERADQRLREIEIAAAELKDASAAHEELAANLERRTSRFDVRRSAAVEMLARFLDGQPPLAARLTLPGHGDAVRFIASESRISDPSTAGDLARDVFDELAALLAELHHRRQNIRQAESLLARAQLEVNELRQSLVAERTQFYAERQSQRRRIDEAERLADGELAARREALEVASQQMELRRAAVDQMRAELTIAQREMLEDRLATEELLAQLAGAVPPAELSRQITRTKTRLADFNRLQAEHIADERRRLEALAMEITRQHDSLATQKRELEQWLRRRQTDADTAAARLADHQTELEHQRDLLEKQRFDWEHERQEYQREIRRLLAELGQ
jgi:chromosome segregation ATPase